MQPVRPTEPQALSPVRRRRRRWPYVVLSIVLLLPFAGGWIFWPVSAPPLRVARDTTYLTGPVNPDGTINYVAALNEMQSAGVTAENNAAIPIVQALGPEMIDVKVRPAVLQQLGVGDLSAEGSYFITFADFVRSRRPDLLQGAGVEADARQPMDGFEIERRYLKDADEIPSAADRALMEAWLLANEQALATMAQASQRPRFYVPLCSAANPQQVLDGMCTNGQLLRAVRTALGLRAALRAMDGDLERAWQDSQALHRLGGLCGQQLVLIGRLMGVSFDEAASSVDVRIVRHSGLSAGQARTMLNQLRELPELPSVEDAIDIGERCMNLDCVMQVMRAPVNLPNGKAIPGYLTGAIDFNLILRRVNAAVDATLAPLRVKDYGRRQRMLQEERDEFVRSTDANYAKASGFWGIARFHVSSPRARQQFRSEVIGDMLLSLTMPALGSADGFRLQAEMRRQLSQVAFALAIWHADKGGYPETLSDLVPAYLPQVPNDAFAGKPLTYRPTGTGYLLYSIGLNGKDDGGVFSGAANADDLVVRMGGSVPASASQP